MTPVTRIASITTLAVSSTIAWPTPSHAQSPAVQAAINEQILEGCMEGGGQFAPEGIIQRDLTGDGLDDLILDHSFLNCDQSMRMFCGAQACSAVFYIRQGDRLVKTWEALTVGVAIAEGNPPVINLTAHGGSPYRRQWNGQTFAEPGPETLPEAAQRWRYDPSRGLAGQASIQGENGSTLLVDCGNGGFPSLTLYNAAAPTSANLTFNLDGVPAQTYLVNCGDDQNCSIESGHEGTLALTRGLMARNTLTITWNRHTIDRYTLAGSSAAISQMEPRGCEL